MVVKPHGTKQKRGKKNGTPTKKREHSGDRTTKKREHFGDRTLDFEMVLG